MLWDMDNKIIKQGLPNELEILTAALKSISQGVVISDRERIIISTNKAFEDITGYHEDEIIGKDCKFLQGPLSDKNTVRNIAIALHEEKDFFGTILNYQKNGTPFWNDLIISPIRNAEGVVTHFVGVTRDITERINSEEKIAEKMREIERINELMFDRELKMIELKEVIAGLRSRIDQSEDK